MEQEVKQDGRKRRVRAPRPSQHRNPLYGMFLRERWKDPEYRERMTALRRAEGQARRNDPLKLWSRRGVFDGTTRAESEQIWADAAVSAERNMAVMKADGTIEDTIDPRSEQALLAALAVMNTPSNQASRLAAARLVLDFTRAKPAAKIEVKAMSAEQWLEKIAKDETQPAG